MEKDRNARIIAIVALVLAVAGVSIGFAVLSTNLTIEPIDASVKANDDLFTVYFSNKDSEYSTGEVTPTLSESDDPEFTGNTITIEDKSTTLSGIGGTFTEPGQTITYTLGVSNLSKLRAYLNEVIFENVDGTDSKVKCESVNTNGNGLDEGSLKTACDAIKVSIIFDNNRVFTSNAKGTCVEAIPAKTNQPGMKKVIVKITYDDNAIPTTGDFKATFGKIKLIYQTESTSIC